MTRTHTHTHTHMAQAWAFLRGPLLTLQYVLLHLVPLGFFAYLQTHRACVGCVVVSVYVCVCVGHGVLTICTGLCFWPTQQIHTTFTQSYRQYRACCEARKGAFWTCLDLHPSPAVLLPFVCSWLQVLGCCAASTVNARPMAGTAALLGFGAGVGLARMACFELVRLALAVRG